jgi:hypothetical protein
VNDPVAADGQPEERARTLRSVPLPVQPVDSDAARLADELAAALRAIRGYVPHHIWWDAGPAHALLAYQALQAT